MLLIRGHHAYIRLSEVMLAASLRFESINVSRRKNQRRTNLKWFPRSARGKQEINLCANSPRIIPRDRLRRCKRPIDPACTFSWKRLAVLSAREEELGHQPARISIPSGFDSVFHMPTMRAGLLKRIRCASRH